MSILRMPLMSEKTNEKFLRAYLRENLHGEVNNSLLSAFRKSRATKADMARKIGRKPEQITRWLSSPCNLNLDTLSDLALSMGYIPRVTMEPIEAYRPNTYALYMTSYSGSHSRITLLLSKTQSDVNSDSADQAKINEVSETWKNKRINILSITEKS